MPGMGCGSVPKHGTEIVGILWRLYGLSVTVQNFSGCERACWGARGRAAAGRAAGRWALGARQAGAGRWARGRQALGAGRAAGRRWARGAHGLGAWAGLGQCTRCTRPIFDPF